MQESAGGQQQRPLAEHCRSQQPADDHRGADGACHRERFPAGDGHQSQHARVHERTSAGTPRLCKPEEPVRAPVRALNACQPRIVVVGLERPGSERSPQHIEHAAEHGRRVPLERHINLDEPCVPRGTTHIRERMNPAVPPHFRSRARSRQGVARPDDQMSARFQDSQELAEKMLEPRRVDVKDGAVREREIHDRRIEGQSVVFRRHDVKGGIRKIAPPRVGTDVLHRNAIPQQGRKSEFLDLSIAVLEHARPGGQVEPVEIVAAPLFRQRLVNGRPRLEGR